MKRFNLQALENVEKKRKKAWVPSNITMIRVVLMNPELLSFYAYKAWKPELVGYTRPLTKMLDDEDESVLPLKIKFVTNRKVPGSDNTPLLTKGDWNWVTYLRPLVGDEVNDAFDIAKKWGQDVVDLFNNTIVPKCFTRPEVFRLDAVSSDESAILNISDHLIQRSVISYVKEFFMDQINDGSFFEDDDILDVFFPGVEDVSSLLSFY